MSDDDRKSRPPSPTRRKFLLTSGSGVAASLVAAYVPASAKSTAGDIDSDLTTGGPSIAGAVPITLRLNGKDPQMKSHPPTTPPDWIRETVTPRATTHGV